MALTAIENNSILTKTMLTEDTDSIAGLTRFDFAGLGKREYIATPTASATAVDSAALTKRHDPVIPTSLGQIVTHHNDKQDGRTTMVYQLAQTSPRVWSDTFWHLGTTHTVVISEVTETPGVAVQTFILNDYTERRTTSTSDVSAIGSLTSVELDGFEGIEKRGHIATAAPTAHASKGKPKHPKDERDDSDGDISFTPARRDVDDVDTVTILDERPGHTTLNPGVVDGHSVTGVTIVSNRDGTKVTVSATVDAYGEPSLATLERVADPSRVVDHWRPAKRPNLDDQSRPAHKHIETTTLNLYIDEDDTTIIRPTKSGKHTFDQTARVVKLVPTTTKSMPLGVGASIPKVRTSFAPSITEAPIPKVRTSSGPSIIEAPVPEVDIASSSSTVLKIVTQTVTVTKPVHDMAVPTLQSLAWDPVCIRGRNRIMDMPLEDVMERHPDAGWDHEIPGLAEHYRNDNPDMTEDTSFKYAFIMLHKCAGQDDLFPQRVDAEYRVTQPMIDADGTLVPMTAPTQTVHGTPVVLDQKMKYTLYNPLDHPVAPTGSCHRYDDDHDDDENTAHLFHEIHDYNKTECAIEKCMWKYMKPINITTAMPALMMDNTKVIWNYFTHETHLHQPHWGTTHTKGVYYPTTSTIALLSGTAHPTVARAWPRGLSDEEIEDLKHLHGYHGKPDCHDIDTCYAVCRDEHDDGLDWEDYLLYTVIGIVGLATIIGLVACCCLCIRRRKRDPNRRKSSLSEKLQRKPSEKPQVVVVNQATGQTTDPAGHPVDPSTAPPTTALSGPAAGTEATRHQPESNNPPAPTDDGRGTTGRRAEEGRGRVNFAEGSKPADESTQKPSTEAKPSAEPKPSAESKPSAVPAEQPHTDTKEAKPAGESSAHPAATEHTEPVPVHDKDGAGGSGTGRHQPDVGSMRGRKRNRPEGITALGF